MGAQLVLRNARRCVGPEQSLDDRLNTHAAPTLRISETGKNWFSMANVLASSK